MPSFNFREANWDKFKKNLQLKLTALPDPITINNEEQLNNAMSQLTSALQDTIQESIRKTKPRPDAKRWWNSDLNNMKKRLNRLRS